MTHPAPPALARVRRAPPGWQPPKDEAAFDVLLAGADALADVIDFPEPARGRPAAGQDRRSIATAIRLPAPLMKALKSRAAHEHVALNALIRQACVAYLRQGHPRG